MSLFISFAILTESEKISPVRVSDSFLELFLDHIQGEIRHVVCNDQREELFHSFFPKGERFTLGLHRLCMIKKLRETHSNMLMLSHDNVNFTVPVVVSNSVFMTHISISDCLVDFLIRVS